MARKSEPLRQRVPERTCTKTYKSYRSFKKDLRKDFNRRCGYCDDHDDGFWRGFQIDHFIPQTQQKKYKIMTMETWCTHVSFAITLRVKIGHQMMN